MSEFYDEIREQGLTKDVLEHTITSPLFRYLKNMWTRQLEILRQQLETTKSYEDLKFKLGQIADIRYNLNQLIQMEQVIYPQEVIE